VVFAAWLDRINQDATDFPQASAIIVAKARQRGVSAKLNLWVEEIPAMLFS
jgi:hypothetical protein